MHFSSQTKSAKIRTMMSDEYKWVLRNNNILEKKQSTVHTAHKTSIIIIIIIVVNVGTFYKKNHHTQCKVC